MIFDDTITLFNSFPSGYSVNYSATVLKNVSLQVSLDSASNTTGVKPSNSIKLYIMNDSKLSKAYLSSNLWTINEQKDWYFTLKQGDFITKGEITTQDIDYQNMKNTLDDVYKIKGVAYISDSILPHWEVLLEWVIKMFRLILAQTEFIET